MITNMILPGRMVIAALVALVALVQLSLVHGSPVLATYKDPHYLHDRTTMLQMFEWTFRSIARECESFLGPAGYAGVQVSPINEYLVIKGRPWYERYQPISYKIISRSGTEDEFKDMVSRCNAAGVRVYVDVVLNHMTKDVDNAFGIGGSTADTKKRLYPGVPYGPEDFHPYCKFVGYTNLTQVRNCDFLELHDLDQSKEHVREVIVEFLNRVIDHGVAGFRIDSAKYMWPEDLKVIYDRLNNLREDDFGANKRPFIYQEVVDLGLPDQPEESVKWDYNENAMVMEFTYEMIVGNCFGGKAPLTELEKLGSRYRDLMTSESAVVLVDNHDTQRIPLPGIITPCYKTPRPYTMAVAFMLAHPYGSPLILSSYAFEDITQGPPADGDENILAPEAPGTNVTAGEMPNDCGIGWVCEHRWPEIYGMMQFRNLVQKEPLVNFWSKGDNQIAFSRGALGFIAFNSQKDTDLQEYFRTGLPAGEYCDVISGRKVPGKCTGKTIKVEDDGSAYIELLEDDEKGVLAIHAKTKL